MSLDSLFKQILLAEQHSTDQAQQLKEVDKAIIRCQEEIKRNTEELEKKKEERDKQDQKLSALRLQFELMKKQEKQMLTKEKELLCQRSHLQERLAKIKTESTQERETFLGEITRFNSDFCLRGNRETESESQTRTELYELERKAESLHRDMDMMIHSNSHLSSLREQKRALQLELQGLDDSDKELERQLKEAEAVAGNLRAESLFVSQKPLTDSNCLRLKKELESYKEGELELQRHKEALSSEIQFLKPKLFSSQGSEQHLV